MWKKNGKRYEMGLGAAPTPSDKTAGVSLQAARDKAEEIRAILRRGGNPFMEMEERKAAIETKTFGTAADDYVSIMKPSWSNPKHVAQWEMTLGDSYCAL